MLTPMALCERDGVGGEGERERERKMERWMSGWIYGEREGLH